MVLSSVLDCLRHHCGAFDLIDHWTQGEFHHDVVLRVPEHPELPGRWLVIATNCNGGVKEVLCLASLPDRYGLWHQRCPDNPEFGGPAPHILAREITHHWFDPCELLLDTARSELRTEFKQRQRGGGWMRKT